MFGRTLISMASAIVLSASVSGVASAVVAADPAPERVSGTNLTRIYRGADGGALYLRALGNQVYGFGEHPGRGYAYVLSGTRSGDEVVAKWWDVPKGTRTDRGTIRLGVSQRGARLVRKSGADLGPDAFTAIPPTGIPWPNTQVAGFQATRRNDLDGVFVGDDASRHYVREALSDTVWVAEKASQPGERPGWVTVFIGARDASRTVVSGMSVDVPKGSERLSSNFAAVLPSGKRELSLAQPGSRRTRWLRPDYAVDWGAFETQIRAQLNMNVVGYSYAIARNGAILRSGAGGFRRLGIDGGARSFTTNTMGQTASAAKTINATAIVKALHDRGLSVDTKVKPFLPKCLKLGPGLATLTFRQILGHTSGLSRSMGCNGRDPFACLVDMIATGRTESNDRAYNTYAYDLLRWLVPLVDDTAGTKQLFERNDCKNAGGFLHKKVSVRFVRYVFDEVLGPVGAKASHFPGGDFSLNYDFSDQTKRGEAPREDFFERGGSGKLTMTAVDYVRFLTALEQGRIVPKSRVDAMKFALLGFDGVWNGAVTEGYVWKNGGCPDFQNRGRGCATAAMIFPSGIVAYVATNSRNNGYRGNIQDVLGRAFDAALR